MCDLDGYETVPKAHSNAPALQVDEIGFGELSGEQPPQDRAFVAIFARIDVPCDASQLLVLSLRPFGSLFASGFWTFRGQGDQEQTGCPTRKASVRRSSSNAVVARENDARRAGSEELGLATIGCAVDAA